MYAEDSPREEDILKISQRLVFSLCDERYPLRVTGRVLVCDAVRECNE
jgi:hypothetical protein